MADSILFIMTKPPYGFEEFFAGARASLAMLASGLIGRSTLLLVGDGTLNAVTSQDPEAVKMPSNVEAINDLADFEGEVYCIAEDLRSRVGDVPVIEGVKMIEWEKAKELVFDHQMVTTF
ncbi:MAG TPA: DsrE family protein [Methanomassiliicoccales archaeon]|nr:DsrE family protein [Methanomassiliicoccales archaeon]